MLNEIDDLLGFHASPAPKAKAPRAKAKAVALEAEATTAKAPRAKAEAVALEAEATTAKAPRAKAPRAKAEAVALEAEATTAKAEAVAPKLTPAQKEKRKQKIAQRKEAVLKLQKQLRDSKVAFLQTLADLEEKDTEACFIRASNAANKVVNLAAKLGVTKRRVV